MNQRARLHSYVALAAGLTAFAVPTVAEAQGLFDALFGAPKRRTIYVDEFPPEQRGRQPRKAFPPAPKIEKKQAVRKAAPIQTVAAPAYYTYKPDLMVRVDFSKLVNAPQKASLSNVAFADGLPGLTDYVLRAEKPAATALADYYSGNQSFIWVADGKPNERAEQARKIFAAADEYALSPTDYAVEQPDAGADAAALMRFEMAMSARALRYAHDAQSGRIDPNRITGYYDFPDKALDMSAVLASLSSTTDASAILLGFHPKNAQYGQLKAELAALRKEVGDEVSIDPNLKLKVGQSSPEFVKLTSLIASRLDDEIGGEFGPVLAKASGSETYSEDLAPVIKALQKKAGLKADGVIGPRTVGAIVGPNKADRLQKVEVALEQLRWLPSEFGGTRVWINQPAYTAEYIENETPKLSMNVVIGRTANQTSFFYDEIEQIDYNPYWGVPQSIIVNEMLPRLRRDPGYLDRAGYEVTNAKGKKIPSSSVEWGAYGSKVPYSIRQTPSEANALGELKILFPNKHAIYMHDTPQKSFFKRDMRALSHGCIRLSDPRGMAAAVMGTDVKYIADKLKKGHSTDKTPKIPVYVSYFTAWPNAQGTVEYFNDVYSRDARLQAAVEATDQVRNASAQQLAGG